MLGATVVLIAGCASAESDAVVRDHAHKYADCVNRAVDQAIANDQNRLVVENRVVRECYRIFESLPYKHHITMEDNDHNFDIWKEIVRPAEKRVKTVAMPDPTCQLVHVERCPPEQG